MHMPTCPNGHTSADADYCDECGAAIGGAAASSGAATAVATEEPTAPAAQTCPQCGATRTGRFCEVDGYDFVAADLRGDQPATGGSGSGTGAGGSGAGGSGADAGGSGAGAGTAEPAPGPGGTGGDASPAPAPDGPAGGGAATHGPDAGAGRPGGTPEATRAGTDDAAANGSGDPSSGSDAAGPSGGGSGAGSAGANGAGAGSAGAGSAGSGRDGADGSGADGAGSAGTDGAGSAGVGGAAAGTRWRLAVRADHDYHLRVLAMNGPDAEQMEFPKFAPERQFALRDDQVLVGRASRSRGIEPQIDLTGPPEDPGVSRSHAMLVHGADGWSVVDLDSANGTYLNDSDEPIAANQPVPLRDGDRIHVGAWTTLQLLTA
jgi:hypothetical protein